MSWNRLSLPEIALQKCSYEVFLHKIYSYKYAANLQENSHAEL